MVSRWDDMVLLYGLNMGLPSSDLTLKMESCCGNIDAWQALRDWRHAMGCAPYAPRGEDIGRVK